MANQKRSKLHYIILWLTGILGIGIICAAIVFWFHLNQLSQSDHERQTAKTNAVKGKVWYERADRAHEADNHDKEFELLLKSASFDHVPAILRISKNYETGNYVHKSELKAQEWAAKLPQNQYIKFLYRRGYALTETGQSIENNKLGVGFLEDAVEIASENQSKNIALQRIGWIYSEGPESLRDKVKAQQVFEIIGGRALENFLGMEGFVAEQAGEHKKARELYQQAADVGSIKAKVMLAYSYANDTDNESSEEKVTKLIAEVLETDEPDSRHQIAKFLIEYRSQEEESLGLGVMEMLADSGFERSSLYLIDYYSDNPNIDSEYIKTAKYIQELTHLSAKTKVTWAHLKRTGTAVTQDNKTAFKLYEEAANDGYDPAKLALAHMHRLGIGTSKDPGKAKILYQAARYDERHPASYYIGLMYENGELGKADIKQAITLYELAAQSEYGPALMRLAKLHEAGTHIPQDSVKAFKLMTEAAYTDSSEAIENLARYYTEGIGTERNSEYAALWRAKKEPRPVLAFPEY